LSPKVSIIIPVYNRPTLIARCLDSCISQTMLHSDYEIIVVDDCSTDNTMQVLEVYCNRYPDLINIISLPENSGGASRPRNVGIRNANGEYLFFVDSDDTIHPDLLYDGYNQAKSKNCDLLIVTFYTAFLSCFPENLIFETESFLTRQNWNCLFVLPGHFFKHKQIKSLNIFFSEDIHGIEDNLFVFSFMFNSLNLRWDIIRGKISRQYNGFIRGEPYYFQDTSRNHSDSGTITSYWEKGNGAIPIIEQTFARVAIDPRLADKIHLALFFLGNLNERGELPISVSSRTISDERFKEFHEAICSIMPCASSMFIPSSIELIISAFRTNDKTSLPHLVDSHLSVTFQTETNFLNYLGALKSISKEYLVVISVKDSACYGNFKPEYSSMLIPFNLERILFNKPWHSYIGIFNDGIIAYEELSINTSKFSGKLGNVSLEVKSQGYSCGNFSSVKINSKEYSMNRSGLNIVVFDKTLKSVIDVVNFDMRTYSLACLRNQYN